MRQCIKARRELEEQAAKARTSRSMRRRRWARRATSVADETEAALLGDQIPENSLTKKPAFEERTVTELESQMMDLEEFLRDLGDEEEY